MDDLEVTRPTYVKGEFTIDNPALTSINQRQSLEKIQARRKVNLTDGTHDAKDEARAPSLDYIFSPQINSKTMLRDVRRNQLIADLKLNEARFE